MAQPTRHIQTTQACDSCHTSTTFTGARFDHVGVLPGSCASCHTGVRAKGKPTNHIATTASCDQCHTVQAFSPATAQPANHIPVAFGVSCTACHAAGSSFSVMPSLTAIHANAPSTSSGCATCHGAAADSFALPNGFKVVGMPGNHLPTTAPCERCHTGTGTRIASLPVISGSSFGGASMSHQGISSGCETCHTRSDRKVSFAGIVSIVSMPPTSPAGPGSHIPTSAPCENCHLASLPAGLVPASAGKSPPGTGFASPAPSGAQIHAGITSGCAGCHEAGQVWLGIGLYPASPAVLTPGGSYNGFQTRPRSAATATSVADPNHPSTGDCSACHGSTTAFTGVDKPANHIPIAAGAACSACHVGSDYSISPSLTAIHANAPNPNGGCAQCHGAAAASFSLPATGFKVVGQPANHIPTSSACEICHVGPGAGIATLPVNDGARFSNGLMNHQGISSGCAACHQPSGNASNFAGISRIVGMPPTSPAGPNSHIPSSTACESCHLASLPKDQIEASATLSPPGTGFATPAPSGAQIHAGVTSGCSTCHEAGQIWLGVGAYPISPTSLSPGALYKGFQTRPKAAAGSFNVADAAHPTNGDCSACHGSTAAFSGIDKPANHIPYSTSATCDACHTSSDYAVVPTLAAIHANAQSASANCAQCHGSSAASFAIPAVGFSIVGLPGNHLPTTASCETCHVGPGSSVPVLPVPNGAKFSGSTMSHAGIGSGCSSCHLPAGQTASFAGINTIVGMPATSPVGTNAHLPSGSKCENCHLGSLPSGNVPANASKAPPGTAFATPAPTGVQIHAGVTSGCAACHDTGMVWMGVAAYPISPTIKTAGASYNGFQTRPKATSSSFNVADAAHPNSGDCSLCHSSTTAFTSVDKPANHIPYSVSATCTSCHTSTDYSLTPTLAAIHANAPSTTGNCNQCHGSAAASFAIPSANFAIVGLPGNHIPTAASCEVCHVGAGSSIAALPVPNGARFSGSTMSHAGITNNCASCHLPAGQTASFAGISVLVGMPPTSPPGSGSHIPSATTCETCHLGSMPSGTVPASATRTAPGTAFATPAPTGLQIHAGVTAGCSGCHDSGMVWMGVSAYPISPTTLTPGASYKGFQTRPKAAAGTFNIADAAHPTSRDCADCHSSTTAFTAIDKPANHIPYAGSATCSACHTSGDFSVMPTLAAIHANAPSATGNCGQCHGAAASSFSIASSGFAIVGLPGNHLPTTASCEACHVGAGSSVPTLPVPNGAKFSGSLMSHAGITKDCVSCHAPAGQAGNYVGIGSIIGMPATSPVGSSSHIPSSMACESCHLASTPAGLIAPSASKLPPGTGFATPAPTGAQIHAGVTSGCSSCHESSYVWQGVSAYPISPTVLTAGASYNGFQTRPRAAAGTFNVADAAHPNNGDCSACHGSTTAFTAVDRPANHIPYAAGVTCTACHTSADFSVMPTLAAIHANAQSTTANCAQCHGANAASFAIPAANFSIVGLPGNHLPTTASCEACHVGAGSSVPALPVPNGAKFSGSRMSHAGITSGCVSCHVPSGTPTNFAGISSIVGMPVTSPAGANSHIPSSTTCEACHLATAPSGLIAANATKTAPGTLFATPAPTGPQIHAGVTSGCAACHDTGMVWMGVSSYPISPTIVTPGANYNGFQTRPKAAAGTFNVADAGHPASGDCSTCHSGTTYFSGAVMPAGHIPTPINSCSTCHVVAGDFSIAGLTTSVPTLHTGITSGCRACHVAGPGAGPFAGCTTQATCTSPVPLTYQPKVMPLAAGASPTAPSTSTHIPVGTVPCESCHSATTFTTFGGVNMKPPAGTTMHSAVAAQTCMGCHERPYKWYGVTIRVRDSGHTGNRAAPNDCNNSGCHQVSSEFRTLLRPIPVQRTALNGGLLRLLPRDVMGGNSGPASHFDHVGVLPGQCQSCHNGQLARAQPAKHWMSRTSCDTCHRTSAWLPAQFNHRGVITGQCQSCHNGIGASGKPGMHFVTVRSCDSCHKTIAWRPASYQHLTPAYRALPDKLSCVSCHITNGEVIPRQLRGGGRPGT